MAAFLVGGGTASGQEASSVYSALDLRKCAIVKKTKETASVVQRCTVSGNFQLYVAEDDLRFFVGYGPNGQKQKAFGQTLAPFNSIHNTIELRTRPGARQPFAAILRYLTEGGDGERKGQVLVVTKIDGREACHMAYIDALANPNPNALAQRTADSMAASFKCRSNAPRVVGAKGRSPM